MEVNRTKFGDIAGIFALVVLLVAGAGSAVYGFLELHRRGAGTIAAIIGGVSALLGLLASLTTSLIASRSSKAKITFGGESREITVARDVPKEVRAGELIQKLKEMGYELHDSEVSDDRPEKQ